MEKEKKFHGNTIVTIILLAICVYLAAMIGMKISGTKKQGDSHLIANNDSQKTVNVTIKQLEKGTFQKTSTTGATLKNDQVSANLYSTEVAGKIISLDITEGQMVKSGDIIATVDPSTAGEEYKPSTVKASVSGIVDSVSAYVGEKIATTTPLATIVNTGKLEVVANLSERYLSTVKVGMTASFTTSAWPDETMQATVKSISPTVDEKTRTFMMKLSLDKPDPRLKEGMYVRLKLVVNELQDVITIPTQAASTYLGKDVAYVVDGGKAKRVSITLGPSNDSETVVESGLSAGEQLITAGSVTDGTVIIITTGGQDANK